MLLSICFIHLWLFVMSILAFTDYEYIQTIPIWSAHVILAAYFDYTLTNDSVLDFRFFRERFTWHYQRKNDGRKARRVHCCYVSSVDPSWKRDCKEFDPDFSRRALIIDPHSNSATVHTLGSSQKVTFRVIFHTVYGAVSQHISYITFLY